MDNLENLKNEIKIPEGIDLAIKKGIEKGKKDKKIKKYQRIYKKTAVAATILIAVTSIGIARPDIVKAVPGIKSIFKLINHGNMGENFDKFEQFSTNVNKAIEKNGLKITIKEITVDDNVLAITSVVEGKNLKENKGYMGNIKINDKLVYTSSSKDKKVDDNTLMMVTYAKVSDMNLPRDLNIDFDIIWVNEVKGPWDFKFNVTKSDKPVNSRIVNIDKSIKIPDRTLNIRKLIISPLGNTIDFLGNYDVSKDRNGFDELDFVVLDDKGKILETHSSVHPISNEKYEGKLEITDDIANVRLLTVAPVFKHWGQKTMLLNKISYPILQTTIDSDNFNLPQETISKSRPVTEEQKSNGYAFNNVTHVFNIDKVRDFTTIDKLVNQIIKVGTNNNVLIKSIDTSENETKITFKVQGNGAYYYINFNDTVLLDENYNFIERVSDENITNVEYKDESIVSIKLPAINKTKKYKIALPIIDEPQIDEQYKININITK
ncbi:DUF4179 domain-containing protein [Candidatus Clostridium radicumherbarum]|uniref:DUF4179 domain-containing protein n=1 Tax=Candidatus Clostridium radicumherbarum TaxID=3381662 RepID=A0ABW8TRH4_9CLOT